MTRSVNTETYAGWVITTVPIGKIKGKDSYRSNLPDIRALANSIEAEGLHQPIVLHKDDTLLSGRRRIAATELIGGRSIKAVVPLTLEGIFTVLESSLVHPSHANYVAPMSIIEQARQYRVIQKAREGQKATGYLFGVRMSKYFGTTSGTVSRAAYVVGTAESGKLSEKTSALCLKLMENGSVNRAYAVLRADGDESAESVKAEEAVVKTNGITDLRAQRNVLDGAEFRLTGITKALAQIDRIHSRMKSNEKEQYITALHAATTQLNRIKRLLKEKTKS